MQKVIIDEKLQFDFKDLLLDVDLDKEFTLRDILRSVVNSKVPIDILQKILRCNDLDSYYKEAESKPFKSSCIDHLRLTLSINHDEYDGMVESSKEWRFDGLGKKGCGGEDVKKLMTESEYANYIEHYSVDLSPMYALADLKIKIDEKIVICGPKLNAKEYKAHPSITLMELLYSVFYEFSWFGKIEERNKTLKDLRKEIKKIEKDITNENLRQEK